MALSPRSQGQNNWLQYTVLCGSSESGTQNNSYNTPREQNTNLLTAALSGPGDICSATANLSVAYGSLWFANDCYLGQVPGGTGEGARVMTGIGGGSVVNFQDTLTITSATLPANTPVQVQCAMGCGGYITPGVLSSDSFDYSQSSASAEAIVYWVAGEPVFLTAPIGADFQTNIVFSVGTSAVGQTVDLGSLIFLTALVENQDGNANYPGCSVVGEVACQIYINVLTPNAGYSAASGTIYPALGQPTLYIQPAANQGVTLSWLSAYPNYSLQQSPSLGPPNWSANNNPVTTTNGTNYVTVSPATGTMFFRLMQQ